MQTLAVLSHKGGTGKTTVAIHLAVAAHAAGRRTLLVDMDGQRSATAWTKLRAAPGPGFQEARAGTFYFARQSAEKLRTDLMVVDTPANCEADTLEAVRWSDLCLIVIRPSFFDIEGVSRTVEAVKALRRPAAILLNQGPTKGEGAIIASALSALERFGLPVLQARLPFRADFQVAVGQGMVAGELEEAGPASSEAAAVWHEIDDRLTLTSPGLRAANG
jgi:chromosome partitioning protein